MNPQDNEPNRYAPPTADVSDHIDAPPMQLADRSARLGGAIIDIMIGVVVVLPMLIGLGINWRNPDLGHLFGSGTLVTLALSIAWILCTLYLVSRNGQTIGKKLVGIKVARPDGTTASLGRIFWLRNVVNAIPGMLPFIGYVYGLVNHLWIFGEKRQCLHDKIADTIVIKA